MNMDSLLARAKSMMQPEPVVQEEDRKTAMELGEEEAADAELSPVEERVEEGETGEDGLAEPDEEEASSENNAAMELEEMAIDADAPENASVELDDPEDHLEEMDQFEENAVDPAESYQVEDMDIGDGGDVSQEDDSDPDEEEVSFTRSQASPADAPLDPNTRTDSQVLDRVAPKVQDNPTIQVGLPDGWQAGIADTVQEQMSDLKSAISTQLDDELMKAIYQLDITGDD